MYQGLDAYTAQIYEPVKEELALMEEKLQNLSNVGTAYLPELISYVSEKGGKRIRPALTLLSASFHPHDHNLSRLMAAGVELLHLATLVHDDTVDNSPLRRGRATVGEMWGRNVAVLLGDYIFATSASFVCDTNNMRVIRRFSETIMELSSGELLEYFHKYDWRQGRENYLDRIYRKTASLFTTACEAGSVVSGADEEAVQALTSYGRNIGIAFQIVDDILDIQGNAEEIGKPVGNDLLEGVLTLPSIMLLEQSTEDNPVKALFENKGQDGYLKQAIEAIQNSSIIDDSYATVREYCLRAQKALSALPESPALHSLHQLCNYVMERRR